MRLISIMKNDSVNSITGFSFTIYVSGCQHQCKGCFSPQTWDYTKGDEYSVGEVFEMIQNSRHKNVSIIGGDPFNIFYRNETVELIKMIKEKTNKKVYVWTGYTKDVVDSFIDTSIIDYLIDGKFEIDKRDIRLVLRGSSNQRIYNNGIDITDELEARKTQ